MPSIHASETKASVGQPSRKSGACGWIHSTQLSTLCHKIFFLHQAQARTIVVTVEAAIAPADVKDDKDTRQ